MFNDTQLNDPDVLVSGVLQTPEQEPSSDLVPQSLLGAGPPRRHHPEQDPGRSPPQNQNQKKNPEIELRRRG